MPRFSAPLPSTLSPLPFPLSTAYPFCYSDTMKNRQVGPRLIAVLATLLSSACAFTQVFEQQAWTTLVPNTTLEPFFGQTVAGDTNGNSYTLMVQGKTMGYPWIVAATDQFGNITGRQIFGNGAYPSVGMAVDPFS